MSSSESETTQNIIDDFNTDCNDLKDKYTYIPSNLNNIKRIIAIGDIHGDLNVAINMLVAGKCILDISKKKINNNEFVSIIDNKDVERKFIWIGKETVVVQVGDQVDRCRPTSHNECIYPSTTINDEASDIKILNFYTNVDIIAKKQGGCVISLLGNHELMNVQGNLKYVSAKGLLEFVNLANVKNLSEMEQLKLGQDNRRKAFTNNNNMQLNKFLACSRTSAIIINGLLFVHGGMIKKMAESYNIIDINLFVRKWLLGKLNSELEQVAYTNQEKEAKLNNKSVKLSLHKRIDELLNNSNSIFWNRLLGNIPSDSNSTSNVTDLCDDYLKDVFNIYNINGIIIGHTPQINNNYGINSACNKKVWRVDIGASTAFDAIRNINYKRIEVLEITFDDSTFLKPIFKIIPL